MANRSGVAGVESGWEDGALVFRAKGSGTELLRIAPGGVSIAGLAFPTADGTAGQVLATDGSGQLSFEDDATA
ncbi:hypothetical protein HUN42_00013 [Streptomyces phage Dagobah]|nr:hypothetical protein HUN42_00013 [Streptomyces phage Dagobah]